MRESRCVNGGGNQPTTGWQARGRSSSGKLSLIKFSIYPCWTEITYNPAEFHTTWWVEGGTCLPDRRTNADIFGQRRS